ncbi:unnamed protein product [Cylindrotheca closterium]|uniref:Uncharacterized protein n=1 Tax=Cylindrotheca closterium TaxID=2856 RepID=A0AAD2CRF5_9STRA|nr:unnamed protein product [Cylindrotheca closterium]
MQHERPGEVFDQVRRGEMQLKGARESKNGEVGKASGNDRASEAVLDRMQSGESKETIAEEIDDIQSVGSPLKRPRTSVNESLGALDNIWNIKAVNSKKGRLDVIHETRELLTNSVAELIQDGKKAHHKWARVQQELDLANEYISSKTHEIERLRALDAKNRENISKLLRTVTSTNEATQEQSQAKVSEARLRSDLLQMTKSRDEARQRLSKTEKRCKLLEKDLAGVKSKLAQELQAKKQMQHHQQAAESLKNAFHGGNQSNIDYYKRKVTELNTHVQGLTWILAERNREIELLQHQKDRFLTQNQQSSRRKEAKGTTRSRK